VLELRSTDKIDRRVINVSILVKVDTKQSRGARRTFAIAAIEIIPADRAHG
jgi:hypothetical protein